MFTKAIVEPNGIYSREETAKLLGISLTTLKQIIRSGQLVVSQPIGIRRVFIKGSSILDMIDRTSVTTKVVPPPIPASTHDRYLPFTKRDKHSRKRLIPNNPIRSDNSVQAALREQPALPVRPRTATLSKRTASTKGGAMR